ncbi:hypothetical protein I7I48_04618 [Histoplasma ohiense]|nr:hypothetical protein I7I48_04618 [Histoplasma ohiense (nom. inval.)]
MPQPIFSKGIFVHDTYRPDRQHPILITHHLSVDECEKNKENIAATCFFVKFGQKPGGNAMIKVPINHG